MREVSMPQSELPLSVMFVIFLALFVLLGIYPAWKRSLARLRKLLQEAGGAAAAEDITAPTAPEGLPFTLENLELDDFEQLVLGRFVQQLGKPLSRKHLDADLHLERPVLNQALESLLKRGLLQVSMTSFFGIRFQLSAAGRAYAAALGFIPNRQGS
jgi:hypothetical protein